MRILAFSDLHGNASVLELLRKKVEGKNYDYMLIAGDLTNADLIPPSLRVYQVKEIFSILEGFGIPYYFVWGEPFRESSILHAIQMKNPQNYLVREIKRFLSSLKFGKHLKEDGPMKIGKYLLTSNPRKIDDNTIFLKHHYREIIPAAVIQLDGHIHYGQRVSNYLNLGFLFRDAAHGADPIVGCNWELTFENRKVSVNFVDLGGRLKQCNCPNHPEVLRQYSDRSIFLPTSLADHPNHYQ